MKSVLLRAPLLTNSGYGVHSRQIFEWLHSESGVDLTVQTLQWGATPWIVNPRTENGLFKKIIECSKSFDNKVFDITFQVQLPDEWDTSLGRYNVGVTALVETDRCNPAWFEHLEKMDKIIVPSEFTKNVIRNTFGSTFDNKIRVIHEWFNTDLVDIKDFSPYRYDERYQFDTKFNLMTIGTLTSADTAADRKNLANTIGWAIEALDGIEGTGIVVKTCLGRGSVKDRQMSANAVYQIVNSFRKSEYPKVHLIHGNMSKKEVAALYNTKSIKGYISATRGEGYGLPLVEAAASAMPVIATGWSGHLDFLGSRFLKVDFEMKDIPASRIDNRIFVSGLRWAEPDKSSFVQAVQSLHTDYERHKSTARSLKKHTLKKFSKKAISKKYSKLLKEICE